MEVIVAADKKIKFLYHYQEFNIEWLKKLLNENKIYMSSIMGFNDPWDCKIGYKIKDVDNIEERTRHAEWFDLACKNTGQVDKNHSERIEKFKADPVFLQKTIDDFNEARFIAFDREYKVYCLSEKNDVPLMWSHYASKHTGICLEFDCRNVVFGSAMKINYKNDYPEFKIYKNKWEENLLTVLTKADYWRYEAEWRVITQEEAYIKNNYPLISKDNYLDIPENSLVSIIAGCRMNEKKIDELQNFIKAYTHKKISLKKAKLSTENFNLLVEEEKL